jgi:NAD(P)-dependent dehydrogenase (short-subunit alcohol dehydrogenase family)
MPVQLDVTDRDDIREAARRHDGEDLLGSDTGEPCVRPVASTAYEGWSRSAFEVNFFGPLAVVRAFRRSRDDARNKDPVRAEGH